MFRRANKIGFAAKVTPFCKTGDVKVSAIVGLSVGEHSVNVSAFCKWGIVCVCVCVRMHAL